VRVGAVVDTGQNLGVAGCTGWCTGTHLHFELRHDGVPTNPMTLGFDR
jgi:murein DD-endopeptidase MepM/ murein hydrolase activator NlpD